MNKIIKIFALAVIFTFAASNHSHISAQDVSPLYFSTQPQAANYNPAWLTNNNFYISMPVFSRLDFGLHTSGFAYKDLINKHPQYDSLRVDVDGFLNKLKKSNYFDLNFATDILGVGFKVKNNFFSIQIGVNVESKLRFSKQLFEFAVHGTDMAQKHADLLDARIFDATAYVTTALGYAREINDQLTVGGKFKIYSGIANVHTNKSTVNLDINDGELAAYGDLDMDIAIPFGKPTLTKNSVFEDDSEFDFNTDDGSFGKMFKNMGFGVDLGFAYKINDQMEISASIVDLGWINWKSNAVKVHSKNPGERVYFSGLETDYDNIGDDLDNYFDDMADSVKKAFDLTIDDNDGYKTMMPTKIYIGYSWNFFDNMYLHSLYYGRIIAGTLENALNLTYTYKAGPVQMSVGNTFRSTFFNPNFLLSLGSIFYIGASFSSSFNVASTSGMNAYMGVNIAFAADKHKSKARTVKKAETTSEVELIF
ncbi:MAG: hypothetical protein J6M30_06915 [Bacteroidales bacterium]|nr:hypothetical protein [Bacteroidales bacterium]